MSSESIDCCVTSPPYWRLRDYGDASQLGLENTPDEYVERLVEVFEEVRRCLKPEGTLWLNIGDSYASRPKKRSSDQATKSSTLGGGLESQNESRVQGSKIVSGLKKKDMVGIPWTLAFALRSAGWYLRQDIIWQKPNALPESVRDRCTKSHEYIFLFSKSEKYYFDYEAIREPAICGTRGSEFHTGKTGKHQLGRSQKVRPSKPKGSFISKGEPQPGQLPFRAVVEMRNKRSVWSVSTSPFKGAHFATFPKGLIEPCILAGSPPEGLVLDPFLGSGTTAVVANKNNRFCLGIELNTEYIALANQRLAECR
ncbi:MAG: DNA-methyltransferase [Bdellovibrionales bacterium]